MTETAPLGMSVKRVIFLSIYSKCCLDLHAGVGAPRKPLGHFPGTAQRLPVYPRRGCPQTAWRTHGGSLALRARASSRLVSIKLRDQTQNSPNSPPPPSVPKSPKSHLNHQNMQPSVQYLCIKKDY